MTTFGRLLSFDGVAHGTAAAIIGTLPAANAGRLAADIRFRTRPGQDPVRDALIPAPRELAFRLSKGTAAPSNNSEWYEDALALYDPDRGPRIVQVQHRGVTLSML